MINAFKYTKQLEEVGFSREQAEIQLQVMAEMIEGDLVTKQELGAAVERLEHKMLQMEYRLVVKICAIICTVMTIALSGLATAFKYF